MKDARRETIRYHEELYSQHSLCQPGTWLHKPAQYVLRSIESIGNDLPKRVLDLGAGVGRHTIPAAQALPGGSTVIGVDLLPSAIEGLLRNAHDSGVLDRVEGIVSDVEQFEIARDEHDLIIACSVLEHVRSVRLLRQFSEPFNKVQRPVVTIVSSLAPIEERLTPMAFHGML